MLGGPLERSGFPPPSGRFTPPRCGLFLLRRSHPPTFAVANGLVTGPARPVSLFFHIATDAGFNTVIAVFNTPMSATGTTTATSPALLPAGSLFYWRVFAGDGERVSVWTTPQSFRTPAVSVPPPPSGGGCCPPPNRFAVVQQVAAETGYPQSGIHVTDFTQQVALRLHQEDPNWGRRLNNSGVIGKDTVAYRIPGTSNPYSVDIVLGATSGSPAMHWAEHGQVGGQWMTP